MNIHFIPILAALCSIVGCATVDCELVEQSRSLSQLPDAVAVTMKRQMGDAEADEIDELRFDGIAVLYEAEYMLNGREVEIIVRPNGEVVPHANREREDDDDDEDDGGDDEVLERPTTLDALPHVVALTLKSKIGDGELDELEEVQYEGITILYEAEYENEEEVEVDLYLYPDGKVAREERVEDDEDEADEEEEEDQEEDDDDD